MSKNKYWDGESLIIIVFICYRIGKDDEILRFELKS